MTLGGFYVTSSMTMIFVSSRKLNLFPLPTPDIAKAKTTVMGQTVAATAWVWKGFPMKTSMAIVVMEVVEFTGDAFILPQTFEIPSFE